MASPGPRSVKSRALPTKSKGLSANAGQPFPRAASREANARVASSGESKGVESPRSRVATAAAKIAAQAQRTAREDGIANIEEKA